MKNIIFLIPDQESCSRDQNQAVYLRVLGTQPQQAWVGVDLRKHEPGLATSEIRQGRPYLLAVQPTANHFLLLSISFFTSNMGGVVLTTSIVRTFEGGKHW